MKRTLLLFILPLILAALVFPACQPAEVPARFEVTSMQIKPGQINVGETATVTAMITNTGGSTGIYTAVLSVDTVRTDSKSLHLEPGASQKIDFSFSSETAGTYQIEIGDSSGKITVKPNLVAKQTELKYDSGFAKDYLAPEKPATGYLVSFNPPSTPFILQSISIMGLVYGGKGTLLKDPEVQVWDTSLKVLYNTTVEWRKFPQLSFLLTNDLENKGGWADIPVVPEVKINGLFYVHIYTGANTGQGFRMGADNSATNSHSDLTVRDKGGMDNIMSTWPYMSAKWFGDKSSVNWMVRVSGNAMLPQ